MAKERQRRPRASPLPVLATMAARPAKAAIPEMVVWAECPSTLAPREQSEAKRERRALLGAVARALRP